jgi:transcriptional regulator with XRE-family HTH domain
MAGVTQIHRSKQPRRPHYIREWAERRGFHKQSELCTALDVDKSLVSRWYSGATPGVDYQNKLAGLFSIEPESLFRHPDDDWIARFFKKRSAEEIERAKRLLETAFPDKTGTED